MLMRRSDMLGERLKQARTSAGLTQKELGKKAGGLSEAMISMVENGRKLLSHRSLEDISDVLGISPLYLLKGYSEK